MSKKTPKTKPAAATEKADAPPKRSKLKLALLALAPLVLAGGGYGGWTYYAGGLEATAEEEPGTDATHVAAIPPEVAAESSFTYSFALSELLTNVCGPMEAPALKAAAEAEAHGDGTLANLSWMAANRRLSSVTEKSCSMLRAEIGSANAKAKDLAEAGAGKDKPKAAAH